MYNPSHFVEDRPHVLHALMAAHPLATLIHRDGQELVANHIPLMFEPTPGVGRLVGHVARANPFWQAAQAQELLVVFQGPQAYISPNWYPSKADHGKVVPTWNYAVVHAYGQLQAVEDATAIRGIVARLTRVHEATNDKPWTIDDAPADFTTQLLNAIVGIEITLSRIEGKWKVSQNRAAADRAGVAAGLIGRDGDAARAMAQLVAVAGEPD